MTKNLGFHINLSIYFNSFDLISWQSSNFHKKAQKTVDIFNESRYISRHSDIIKILVGDYESGLNT